MISSKFDTGITALLLAAAFHAPAAIAQPTATGSLLERDPLTAVSSAQSRLPDKLNENSGRALTDGARMRSITDECAVVYEHEYTEGRLENTHELGYRNG